MKLIQKTNFLYGIILLFEFVQSVPEWAETENGIKYLIESKYEYTWFEALHECSKRNLTLVALDTAEKNSDMVKLLKNRFGMGLDLWLGATVSTAENTQRKFVWVSNGQSFDFSHWQDGEPNNLGGEQCCVHTWNISNDFRWADGQWHLKYGYICEEIYTTLHRKELEKKRQVIEELNNKLMSFYEEKQERIKMYSDKQQALIEEINLEFGFKLLITKTLIDSELEN